jgi:hypothetical protein
MLQNGKMQENPDKSKQIQEIHKKKNLINPGTVLENQINSGTVI